MIAKNGVNWEEWGFTVYGECPEYKHKRQGKNRHREKNISFLPSYKVWKRLVQDDRGNGDKKKTLCDEWKDFDNFQKWYAENYYVINGEEMRLFYNFFDKTNILLSPKTCVYLPRSIINFKRDKSKLFDYIAEHEKDMPKTAYDKVIQYCLEEC